MTSLREPTPEEGAAEAAAIVRQMPLRMPSYDLKRVHVATLNVDYAPPHGNGYARPLSEGRLRVLRRDWDSMACSPLMVSRRDSGIYYVIDGNHRRVVAFEKGITQLPAMIFSGLERAREADLYTKLGTVLGQTPWTRFLSKLAAGDTNAATVVQICADHGFELDATAYRHGCIQAVARVEWIYARSGADGLSWVLSFLATAFDGARDALGEMQLEGVFGFYQRYGTRDDVQVAEVARLVGAGGVNAWHDRAAAIWSRVDVGRRSNTYGMAIADMINESWKKRGVALRNLLPAWVPNLSQARFGQAAPYSSHGGWNTRGAHNPAPQQLEHAS